MRILLTGHKGYIGTVMAPLMANAGHEVVGLDSDLFEQCTFGDAPQEFPSIRKDVRDVELKDLKGFEAVIHLAGLSNDPLGNLNPNLTYDINHHASVRLARLSKEAGVKRFLFSSSCSTYGAAGDKIRFDLVLNNLTAWALTTGRVFIKSDGTPWRPIVHIEDISRAFLAALEAPRDVIHNQAFNVGRGEENYQIRDLADIVKETVPGCTIEFAEDAGPDKRCYRADFGRIKKALPAFQPEWDARRGARELYEAYKKVGLRAEEFEGARYKRIDHIQGLLASGRLNTDLRWQSRDAEHVVQVKSV